MFRREKEKDSVTISPINSKDNIYIRFHYHTPTGIGKRTNDISNGSAYEDK